MDETREGDAPPQVLERKLEEAVRKALGKLKVPRREELQQLNARLDAIAARLEALGR